MSIHRTLTFDLMVRSERFAAAAAILRMSGLLLDFMISGGKNVSVTIRYESGCESLLT